MYLPPPTAVETDLPRYTSGMESIWTAATSLNSRLTHTQSKIIYQDEHILEHRDTVWWNRLLDYFSPLLHSFVSYSLLNIYLHVCFVKIALGLITLLSDFQDHLGWRLNASSFLKKLLFSSTKWYFLTTGTCAQESLSFHAQTPELSIWQGRPQLPAGTQGHV